MQTRLQSEVLGRIHGVIHGFGSKSEPVPSALLARWNDRPTWKQVHGVASVEIREPKQICGEADALYSRTRGIPVAVMTADCVPILMARSDGHAVAAIHSGWRGTQANILRELWKTLIEQGEEPSRWVAAIGPAIGPCCYQVSEELSQKFEAEFTGAGKGIAVPSHRMLDLPAINAWILRDLGLAEVDLVRACTKCSAAADGSGPLFHSYRREGGGTRQWSIISVE